MEPLFNLHGIESMPVFSTSQADWKEDELHSRGNVVAFVLDGKGWLVSRRSSLFEGLVRVKEVEGVPVLKEAVYFIPSKLPAELMDKVVEFFRLVYRKQKSEAAGLLLYCGDSSMPAADRWQFVVPDQVVGGASADYHGDKALLDPFLSKGYQLAGTIHSHGSMSAFHSGTDHKDEEKFDGLHITVGKVDNPGLPEFAVSIISEGKRFKFDSICDVVDYRKGDVSVPTEWMDAVREKVYLPAIDSKKEVLALENAYNAFESGQISFGQLAAEINEQEEAKRSKKSKKRDVGRGFLDIRRFSRWSEG